MIPNISIIPVGCRWSYIVTISKENYNITIKGNKTYIDERMALRMAQKVATEKI